MKTLLLILLTPIFLFSQYNQNFSFIKNQGQFDDRNWEPNSKIDFGVDYNNSYIFLSEKGICYRFDKFIRNPKKNSLPKKVNISEIINLNWIGANTNVKIITVEQVDNYYSYAIRSGNTTINKNNIEGYKRIVYKNLYNNIDVIYEINPNSGIEYSFVVHKGANISDIKLKYSSSKTNYNNEFVNYKYNDLGDIVINTSLGNITEHKPKTFYKNNNIAISSSFKFENNILSFNVDNYDKLQEIIIDPWIESPNFTNSNAVWEVETDAFGNCYVIGGESPMKLNKYNSLGNLEWSYTTPWDTASYWLGTLKTDRQGNSYITSGTTPEIEKIDTDGNMIWHRNGTNNYEYWGITFNADTSKLIVGGTYAANFGMDYFYSAIFELDIDSGIEMSIQVFDTVNIQTLGIKPIEVRTICTTNNSEFVFLTHNDIGKINQNTFNCNNVLPDFKVDNKKHYSYKAENYIPTSQNGGSLKALAVSNNYIYTHTGDSIFKFDIGTGQFIWATQVLGGSCNIDSTTNTNIVHNCGLDIDSCGNVYAGSGDRVIKYDADLNFISEQTVSFTVYDVSVNNNGEVIAVGAQYDNQATIREGRIQSIDFGSCGQYSPEIENNFICGQDSICINDSSITFFTASAGIWSGNGITDIYEGVFTPSIAGSGYHTIIFTNQNFTDSLNIYVSLCDEIEICKSDSFIITNEVMDFYYSTDTTYAINTEQQCIDCPNATPNYDYLLNYIGCSSSTCTDTVLLYFETGDTILVNNSITFPVMISNTIFDTTIIDFNNIPECYVVTQIGEITDNTIKVYPNPASNELNVVSNECLIENISIIDITGRIKYSINNIDKHEAKLNITELNKGIYFIKFGFTDKTSVIKFIKN